jgi:hypothetical protein
MIPPITFGKHRGKSLYEVAEDHPRWIAWACLIPQFRKFLAANNLAVRVIMGEPDGTTMVEIIEL